LLGVGTEPIVVKLDPAECLALLARSPIGRVAVSIDALPAVRTVRFALSGDSIVFRVAANSRLRRAAAGAVVAFHADHYDQEAGEGWSVMAHGMCEEIRDVDALTSMRSLPLAPWADTPTGDRSLRIPISMISGERVRWFPE
jgi:uncharacterized protein